MAGLGKKLMQIHPTAIIGKKAKLSEDIEVGPYAVIEDEIEIGRRCKIYSHAQILNHTKIGDDCQVHMGAILGHLPQIRQNQNKTGRLTIGRRNIFREYATIHRSSLDAGATVIGEDNYFMGFSHIAHDCAIGNHVTICNGTLIAGHVTIEDYAFISGNVTVHQFCRIGKLAMVGGLTRVAKDIPPYMLVKGDSAVWAINSVGLRRANLSLASRSEIKQAFKLLYKSGLNAKQAIEQLQKQSSSAEIKHLVNFILDSVRGICVYKNPSFYQRIRSSSLRLKGIKMPAYQLFRKDRKGQEALAVALLFALIVLVVLFLNHSLKEKLQDEYRRLFQETQDSLSH